MIKYVILNGPPGSGKTTIAREVVSQLTKRHRIAVQDSFDAPLKHFFAAALGEKYREADKSKMRSELNGYTLDESLLTLKGAIRNRYGDDVLARWLTYRMLKKPFAKPEYVVVDDGNFREDVESVPNRFVVRVMRRVNGTRLQFDPGEEGAYLNDYHYLFYNDSVLGDLWVTAESLTKCIEKHEFAHA